MPDCMISLEHSIQGASVTYKVAPSLLFPDRAILVMALGCGCLLPVQGKRDIRPGGGTKFPRQYPVEGRHGTSYDII